MQVVIVRMLLVAIMGLFGLNANLALMMHQDRLIRSEIKQNLGNEFYGYLIYKNKNIPFILTLKESTEPTPITKKKQIKKSVKPKNNVEQEIGQIIDITDIKNNEEKKEEAKKNEKNKSKIKIEFFGSKNGEVKIVYERDDISGNEVNGDNKDVAISEQDKVVLDKILVSVKDYMKKQGIEEEEVKLPVKEKRKIESYWNWLKRRKGILK